MHKLETCFVHWNGVHIPDRRVKLVNKGIFLVSFLSASLCNSQKKTATQKSQPLYFSTHTKERALESIHTERINTIK